MRLPPHISKIKRKNINEALTLWNTGPRKNEKQREDFYHKMIKNGWNWAGAGSYKECLMKDSIVVKYIYSPSDKEAQNEISRELQQWRQAPYQFKKHLPITYSFNNGLMIQDRVLVKCGDPYNCKKLKDVNKRFEGHLFDYVCNHGHTLKGTVKFFDWVYNKSWDRVCNKHIKFLTKERK